MTDARETADCADCNCDWATGECQGPIGCKALQHLNTLWITETYETDRLRSDLEIARKALEEAHGYIDACSDLHAAPLVQRLRAAIDQIAHMGEP